MSELTSALPPKPESLWFVETPWHSDQRLAGLAAILLTNALLGNYYHTNSPEAAFLAVRQEIQGSGIRDPRLFVATNGREVQGALLATKDPLPLSKTEIKLFAVQEERRGSGIGSRLLTHAEQVLHASGVRRVVLTPLHDAQSFYERHGYIGVGNKDKRSYFMKKRLTRNA